MLEFWGQTGITYVFPLLLHSEAQVRPNLHREYAEYNSARVGLSPPRLIFVSFNSIQM